MASLVFFANRGGLCARSTTEDREEQAQHDANDDAGDDRKIETSVRAFDPDVAGQASQPFRSESAPQDQPEDHGDCAKQNKEFTNFAHLNCDY